MNPLARALQRRRDDLAALYLVAGGLAALRRERSPVIATEASRPRPVLLIRPPRRPRAADQRLNSGPEVDA